VETHRREDHVPALKFAEQIHAEIAATPAPTEVSLKNAWVAAQIICQMHLGFLLQLKDGPAAGPAAITQIQELLAKQTDGGNSLASVICSQARSQIRFCSRENLLKETILLAETWLKLADTTATHATAADWEDWLTHLDKVEQMLRNAFPQDNDLVDKFTTTAKAKINTLAAE
jgi:hypothetical protein